MLVDFKFERGEVCKIRIAAIVRSDTTLNNDVFMHSTTEEQHCVILRRSGDFDVSTNDIYYVYLQQDQIQGWAYYYDLEKLDG